MIAKHCTLLIVASCAKVFQSRWFVCVDLGQPMRMYVYTNLFGQQCRTAALLFFPLTHPCQCLPLFFFFFFRMWESCHTFCSVLIYGTGHLTTAPRSSNISGFWEPGVCFLSVCVGHSFTLHSVLLRVNKNKWKGMETGGILWGHPA